MFLAQTLTTVEGTFAILRENGHIRTNVLQREKVYLCWMRILKLTTFRITNLKMRRFCDASLLVGLHDMAKVRGSNLNLSQVEAGLDTLLMATSRSPAGGLEIESAAAICERLSRDSVANSHQIYTASSAQKLGEKFGRSRVKFYKIGILPTFILLYLLTNV